MCSFAFFIFIWVLLWSALFCLGHDFYTSHHLGFVRKQGLRGHPIYVYVFKTYSRFWRFFEIFCPITNELEIKNKIWAASSV